MKVLPVEKFIIYSILIVALIFSAAIARDLVLYSRATADIINGEYLSAISNLEKLSGYRDADTLKAYCEIMSEYDSRDFNSIYHCYKGLSKLELDNKNLTAIFAKTTTEVETLYKHYDVSLSAK